MKVAKVVLSLAAVLAVASQAKADAQVWFTATGANGISSVVTDGAAGGNTALKCDVSGAGALQCAWDIVVHSSLSSPTAGYNLRLFGAGAGVSVGAAPNAAYAANAFTSFNLPLQTNGSGFILDGGQAAPAAGASGLQNLVTFRLVLNTTGGDIAPRAVLANNGPAGWGAAAGGFINVQYGANPSLTGAPPYNGLPPNVPVIGIVSTPEPMTVGLLGLGVVALIRRRK